MCKNRQGTKDEGEKRSRKNSLVFEFIVENREKIELTEQMNEWNEWNQMHTSVEYVCVCMCACV